MRRWMVVYYGTGCEIEPFAFVAAGSEYEARLRAQELAAAERVSYSDLSLFEVVNG